MKEQQTARLIFPKSLHLAAVGMLEACAKHLGAQCVGYGEAQILAVARELRDFHESVTTPSTYAAPSRSTPAPQLLDRGQIVRFVKRIRSEQNLSPAVDVAIEMLKRERFWIDYLAAASVEGTAPPCVKCEHNRGAAVPPGAAEVPKPQSLLRQTEHVEVKMPENDAERLRSQIGRVKAALLHEDSHRAVALFHAASGLCIAAAAVMQHLPFTEAVAPAGPRDAEKETKK